MALSTRTKIVFSLITILGIAAYLVVVDLGVSAGRIHHGVHVRGVDVGGLTREEATEILEEHGHRLLAEPVLFVREGFECEFLPHELGWEPRPFETAVAAFRIGRGVAPLRALATRVRAWFSDVQVGWTGRLDRGAVSAFLDECEARAEAVGYEVRRYRLRQRIARAITSWPRRVFEVPIAKTAEGS
ncbi:MAG: hypothetical protein M3161_00780 [Actinomycetota bacterium]|nr:hypothetical protein [Actinomycetota bacterium]